MIRALLYVALTILVLSSCASPYVQSFYAISGTGIEPLPGMQGQVVWADGQLANSMGDIAPGAKMGRLLTFIFLTPGAGGNGSVGSGSDSGGPVAKFDLTNGIPPSKVDAKVEWAKKPDVVKIDGIKYDRANGTLFVIVKSPSSPGEVWQLRSASGTKQAKVLLAQAKKELPHVKAVQAASFDLK